jgi:TetR/AcrR family transcriptional regulator, transcriptional repressor for nem operon
MPVRLKDIAAELGLSLLTVIEGTRNHPDIAEGTRERVLQRIKELDYRPNTMARSERFFFALTGIEYERTLCVVRYSREHKAQNHENILSVAARSFREHGGDTSGIGTVMKRVGLTKGGFYRHFKSKDDLLVEAVARAFDEMGRGMLEIAKSAPEGQALRAIIERYLSAQHANSPGMGCVVSALGPELARKPLSVRKRIEASREAYRERLLPFVPGQTREEKVAKFQLLFPSMAGVLTAVRMTPAPQRREQMLMEARNFFIKCFAEE